MKRLLCIVGRHAERFLWGCTPSPNKEDITKYIWRCPRCGGDKLSRSPREFIKV